MSTPCLIGMLEKDGSVRGVSCHWDGYPAGVGAVLNQHYNREKTAQLLQLGELSQLGAEVAPPEGAKHSFQEPYPEVTVAYHRDRDEQWSAPFTAPSIKAFCRCLSDCPYIYLLEGNTWKLYTDSSQSAARLVDVLR